MIPVEICVNSKNESSVFLAVGNAWAGGASRIELCASMEHDGLTPPVAHIEQARAAFWDRPGLLVMIRPIPGGFVYQSKDIKLMESQIISAAKAGANGVVIGVLEQKNGGVHQEYCRRLVGCAKDHDLSVTFHRAFDATPDWRRTLDTVIALGIDRVLSSGTPWGTATTALDGVNRLAEMIQFADGNIELVVGGGVNHGNVPVIVDALRDLNGCFSLHAYSAVLENDDVSRDKVSSLCSLVGS